MARPSRHGHPKDTLLCRSCGEYKGESSFNPASWASGVTKGLCLICLGAYNRRKYERSAGAVKARRESRQETVHKIKASLGCRECGENHPACLNFHHRNRDEKEYGIGVLTAGGYPMDVLLAEIAKCDVLCSNCHRKHHWEEKHPKLVAVSDEAASPIRLVQTA